MGLLSRLRKTLPGKPVPDYLKREFAVAPPRAGARLDLSWRPKVSHQYQQHEQDGYGREMFVLDDRYEIAIEMYPLGDYDSDSLSVRDRDSGASIYYGPPQGDRPYFGLHRGLAALILHRAGGNPKDLEQIKSAAFQLGLLQEETEYGREGVKEAERQERRLAEMRDMFLLAYAVDVDGLMKSTLELASWLEEVEIGQERLASRPELQAMSAPPAVEVSPQPGLGLGPER